MKVLDTFYFYTPGTLEKKLVGGIPDEVVAGLDKRQVLLKRPNTYGAGAGLTYDPETLKVVWDELVCAVGVRVLLHSYFAEGNLGFGTGRVVDPGGCKS